MQMLTDKVTPLPSVIKKVSHYAKCETNTTNIIDKQLHAPPRITARATKRIPLRTVGPTTCLSCPDLSQRKLWPAPLRDAPAPLRDAPAPSEYGTSGLGYATESRFSLLVGGLGRSEAARREEALRKYQEEVRVTTLRRLHPLSVKELRPSACTTSTTPITYTFAHP
eukprot:GHVR01036444.1.p1 GENE.GHVR01036444.1~~GHVR01036444.1.p1  ORF type:complete len:167 (-),score=20.83 GHVR01036444.1:457-957(-)